MKLIPRAVAAAGFVAALGLMSSPVLAQKHGGILKGTHRATPSSGSIHEEATNNTVTPYASVYNGLVMFDQHDPVNKMSNIQPDLATSWSWDDSKTKLTFKLRDGVKWHDGKPFTAEDVKCTWDLLQGKRKQRLRKNPRKAWYQNLDMVTADNDHQATFHFKRPQPWVLMMLASGYSPVYPCHISPKQMRTNPIGTGPFKFVELKQNEHVKFTKNENYWKKDRPYMDGIEWTIIRSRATRHLALASGEFDIGWNIDVQPPQIKDLKAQAPDLVCELKTTNVSLNVIVNRDKPPFNDAKMRQALGLALDRKSFIDILGHGKFVKGGALLPPPDGVWGMTPEMLEKTAGFGTDVEGNRAKARKIMEGLGYGPNNRLKMKMSTRNFASYRDPAVVLIDQVKEIYIDAELDTIESGEWYGKVARKDYQLGMNWTGTGVDDPDAHFYENYACGSQRNYTGYCNQEIMAMLETQSQEVDPEKRKQLVFEIDRKLQEDAARPIIFHSKAGTCFHPRVKGLTVMTNSAYNGWRFEDVWLDK